MKLRCYFFILVLIFFGNKTISAQEWYWANNFNFPEVEVKSDFGGSDSDGNLYIAVEVASGYVATDYYLLKVAGDGKLVWSRKISQYFQARIVTDIRGFTYLCWFDRLIGIDPSGNEIWVKKTDGQRIFGAVFLHENGFTANGKEQIGDSARIFISTYNVNGDLLTTVYNHGAVLKSKSMAVVKSGNSYMISDAFPDPVTGNRGKLYKYDNIGNLNFHREIPHAPTNVQCDKDENVFITGRHAIFSIQINNQTYSEPGNYITKYDSSGNLLWYKIITGGLGSNSMTLDQDGNLYYVIDYSAEIHINEFELKGGNGGLLLLKFDPEGNILWHQVTPSSNTGVYGYVYPSDIYLDSYNGIYISGSMTGILQFGNYSVETSSNMYSELFIGKIDQNNLVVLKDQKSPGDFEILVYPNPSAEVFQVYFNSEERNSYNITASDIQGRKIHEIKGEAGPGLITKEIDLSKSPAGIYFLEIVGTKGRAVRKIVRN
jgi:hypothetical protein